LCQHKNRGLKFTEVSEKVREKEKQGVCFLVNEGKARVDDDFVHDEGIKKRDGVFFSTPLAI
jgi:hypothetical protein